MWPHPDSSKVSRKLEKTILKWAKRKKAEILRTKNVLHTYDKGLKDFTLLLGQVVLTLQRI